jgi:hypothetical protein
MTQSLDGDKHGPIASQPAPCRPYIPGQRPFISVAIPTFRRPDTVRRARSSFRPCGWFSSAGISPRAAFGPQQLEALEGLAVLKDASEKTRSQSRQTKKTLIDAYKAGAAAAALNVRNRTSHPMGSCRATTCFMRMNDERMLRCAILCFLLAARGALL